MSFGGRETQFTSFKRHIVPIGKFPYGLVLDNIGEVLLVLFVKLVLQMQGCAGMSILETIVTINAPK